MVSDRVAEQRLRERVGVSLGRASECAFESTATDVVPRLGCQLEASLLVETARCNVVCSPSQTRP